MGRLEEAGRQLAALPDAHATATTGRAARDEARHVLREAWRLGVEHQVAVYTRTGVVCGRLWESFRALLP